MKHRRSPQSQRNLDYFDLGRETMMLTRSEERAKNILGLRIQALVDELGPDVEALRDDLEHTNHHMSAVASQLYEQPEGPVSDTKIIGLWVVFVTLAVMCVVVAIASAAAHMTTLYMLGFGLAASTLGGLLLTGTLASLGHLVFEHLVEHPVIIGTAAALAFAIALVGLWEFAEIRGVLARIESAAAEQDSYLDGAVDSPEALPGGGESVQQQTLESKVGDLFRLGTAKIMIAADASIGLLVASLLALWKSPTFAGWRHLRRLKQRAASAKYEMEQLLVLPGAAWKRGMAGIISMKHYERHGTIAAYFRIPPIVVVLLALMASAGFAQPNVVRQEIILLDVSASVATNSKSGLFRDYAQGIRQLLRTAPPSSRVYVMLVSADSFGGVDAVLSGWTPASRGVLVSDLNRARGQLLAAFDRRSAQLAPTATATDLFGALARVKVISQPEIGSTRSVPTELILMSDMMHETSVFQMPALVPLGANEMLAKAKGNGLVVPLDGFRVRVLGATTTGTTPQIWNTVREFWRLYFAAGGAQLVEYSAEVLIDR